MNKLTLLLVFLILIPAFSFCQNELAEINKLIDKYIDTISMQKNQISEQREKIQLLAKRKNVDASFLKKTIKGYQLARLELKDKKEALRQVMDKAERNKFENIVLKERVIGLENDLDRSQKKEDSLNSILSATLKKQGKQKIEEEATQEAQDQRYHIPPPPLKNHTKLTFDGDPLLSVTAGYKFTFGETPYLGVIFHTALGLAITSDRNIFVGLGTGYDGFNTDSGFSAIPLYFSTKFAFDGKFIEKNEINSNDVVYALFDVGFYPIMIKNATKSNISSNGWFANFGLGVATFSGNKNLSINPEISARLQNKRSSIDLRIRLGIYLGR